MADFTWTPEQELIFDEVLARNPDGSPTNPFIKIEAVAGASKTTTLVEIAARLKAANPQSTFRYLVFGNANASEARTSFATTAICSTLHSLAYYEIITKKRFNLNSTIVPFITWRDIPKSIRIPFGKTSTTIDIVTQYCNSTALSFGSFESELEDNHELLPFVRQIVNGMATGLIKPTHDFYLKLFHDGLVNGTIIPDTVDTLALDEAGDLTPITINVFGAYPAHQRIMVGDDAQAIFYFMGCKNGFTHFSNVGKTLHLTQSFRVSAPIAEKVQAFCNNTFAPNMKFEGMHYSSISTTTEAYITRTNSALIEHMIGLNRTNTPYRLITPGKLKQLFKYPLFLLGSEPNRTVYEHELKGVQHTINDWFNLSEQEQAKQGMFSYIREHNEDNPNIASAITLILKYGPKSIIDAYNSADAHLHSSANLCLTTAHSVKGMTFDVVTISDDLNNSIEDIMLQYKHIDNYKPTAELLAELKLYYVAVTRCRHVLNNAKYIV